MDEHALLLIHGSREHFPGFDRNRRVAVDDHVHQTAKRFQAQRQWRDIQQQQVAEPARQDFRLDGGAEGHGFVGILGRVEHRAGRAVVVRAQPEGATGFRELGATEPFPDQPPHQRHAGLPAHEDHLVELIRLQLRVGQGPQTVGPGLLDQVAGQLLKGRPRKRGLKTESGRQERQGEHRFLRLGKLDFGGLRDLPHAGQQRRVRRHVRSARPADLRGQFGHQPAIEIVPAQPRVAVRGQDLEHPLVQLQQGQVEGAAAQVVNRHARVILQLIQTVGERRGRGFVQNPFDAESGEFPGQLRGLALGVVEIRRHRDDRPRDRFAERSLRIVPEFAQDLRRKLLRRPLPPVQRHCHRPGSVGPDRVAHRGLLRRHFPPAPAHEAFDGINRRGGFQHAQPLRRPAHHQRPARPRHMHHGRGQPAAIGIRDDVRNARVHGGDQRVGRAQVDAHYFTHGRHGAMGRPAGKGQPARARRGRYNRLIAPRSLRSMKACRPASTIFSCASPSLR